MSQRVSSACSCAADHIDQEMGHQNTHPSRQLEEAAALLVQLRKEVVCADATRWVMGGCELTAAQAGMVEVALAMAAEGPCSAAAALPDCLKVYSSLCRFILRILAPYTLIM